MIAPIAHGGGLVAAQRLFPDAPKPWLDLSTGINPHAYPVGELARECWTRLPEADDIAALEAVAARAYGARDRACVVAVPGAQSLIQLLPSVFPARSVAVLAPTYAEHAHRWRMSGADVREVEALGDDADVIVIVNPNNPDGRVLSIDALDAIADRQTERGGLLVLDESFADVLPEEASFVSQIGARNVVVLRSFGKFYGLAGLRLGFAVASPALAARLRDALGPWAVSGASVAVGQRALADLDWRLAMRRRLVEEASKLDHMIGDAGLALVGGTPLFRLIETKDAQALWRALGRRGILVRAFADQPHRLRFGLPGEEKNGARLHTALQESIGT